MIYYIIDDQGRYLGNINGNKVLFHRADSATFQKRLTKDMIEKLKARAESLGAVNLTIMEADSVESAREYMLSTYCTGPNAVNNKPKRGRPAGSVTRNAVNKPKKPQKKIEFTLDNDDNEEEEYVEHPEYSDDNYIERPEEEKKYLKAIKDPDVKEMFAKCRVNKKCMLCRHLCKQPSTSVIFRCPQFEYDEYRDEGEE